MFLYADSNVEDFLSSVLNVDGEQYIVYDESGYSPREFLEVTYEGGSLTAWESALNTAMEKVRIKVE